MSTTSTQLVTRNGTDLASRLAPDDWTREYLDTIRNVFGKGCSDAEFALAVQVSKSTGLRIDTRELWVYKRAANEPMQISISIDGFRAIAHASGTYAGEEGPFYCGKDGVWQEVWTGEGLPHAAKFSVWRTDFARPFTAVILVAEFQKLGGFLWGKAPVWMSGIRVATHAYRKAYRQEIARQELAAQATGAQLVTGERFEAEAFQEAAGLQAQGRAEDIAAGRTEDSERLDVDPATGEILSGVDFRPADPADDAVAPPQSNDAPSRAAQERIAALERYEAAHDALTGRGITPTGGKDGKKLPYPRSVPASVPIESILAAAGTFEAEYRTSWADRAQE